MSRGIVAIIKGDKLSERASSLSDRKILIVIPRVGEHICILDKYLKRSIEYEVLSVTHCFAEHPEDEPHTVEITVQ